MKKYAGFTLPELLIALTIVGAMTLLAVPSFKVFYKHQQIRYITQALTQSLSYARLQAVLRYQIILITPKEDYDWQKGWVIETKDNKQILRSFPEMPLEITSKNLQQTIKYIQVLPNGMTDGYPGSFEYGNTKLTFNRAGRTKLEKIKSGEN